MFTIFLTMVFNHIITTLHVFICYALVNALLKRIVFSEKDFTTLFLTHNIMHCTIIVFGHLVVFLLSSCWS